MIACVCCDAHRLSRPLPVVQLALFLRVLDGGRSVQSYDKPRVLLRTPEERCRGLRELDEKPGKRSRTLASAPDQRELCFSGARERKTRGFSAHLD